MIDDDEVDALRAAPTDRQPTLSIRDTQHGVFQDEAMTGLGEWSARVTIRTGIQCSVPGCTERVAAKEVCRGHYDQLRRGRSFEELSPLRMKRGPECSFEGCTNPVRAKGLCIGHWEQQSKGKLLVPLRTRNRGKDCSFEGCPRAAETRGLCDGHYQQLRQGRELTPLRIQDGSRGCSAQGCTGAHEGRGLCARHRRILSYYCLLPDDFAALLRFQGGVCAICYVPTAYIGADQFAWSVDHDHECCPGKRSCGLCVRGLLCGTCNKCVVPAAEYLGEGGPRVLRYLSDPPYARMRSGLPPVFGLGHPSLLSLPIDSVATR